LREFILTSLREDIGDGDHSSLACILKMPRRKSKAACQEKGLLAGCRIAREVFRIVDRDLVFEHFIADGSDIEPGDIVFHISGRQQSILKSERLVLNIMQRMSSIATSTKLFVDRIKGLNTRILDTRKTTPGMRALEKEAVRIGGGFNHRMGLYDMIMLKDNHIDYAGGIEDALRKTREYLRANNKNLKVEIEARDLDEVRRILAAGGADRILLDNFNISDTAEAVKAIGGTCETESSGGITLDTVRAYAECGVDFVSVGALTHHIKAIDMSLKAV
jgi:nicotinate-nucleotide pyrophosphorylase (carboxylating)